MSIYYSRTDFIQINNFPNMYSKMFIRLKRKKFLPVFRPSFYSTPIRQSIPAGVNQPGTIIKNEAVAPAENISRIENTKMREKTEKAKSKKTVKSG